MNKRVRDALPWLVVAVFLVGVAYQWQWSGVGALNSWGPAKDVVLAGGGMSDGGECGVKGFHHFVLPTASTATGQRHAAPPGPVLLLASYGLRQSASDPGYFTIRLMLGSGGKWPMDLSAPLGPQGVAVEIEGPAGLVGGAHGLPVKFDDTTAQGPDGKIHFGSGGEAAGVTMPFRALCPGYNGIDFADKLSAPVDSHGTGIGQPPYTLTVSISDPAIGELRKSLKSPVTGNVLSANNVVSP